MRKNLQDFIPQLREHGWRVWPDPEPDFIPWGDDDLIPIGDEGDMALKQALKGWPMQTPPRRPWRDSGA
jgi:hypothetical protein